MSANPKLRLLLYNPLVTDKWDVGGFRALETCLALSENGVEGTIASPNVKESTEVVKGFMLQPVRSNPFIRAGEITEMVRQGRIDVVQERIVNADFASNGYGSMVSLRLGTPLALEIHNIGTARSILARSHFVLPSLWISKLVLCYARVEGVSSFGVKRSKLTHVPNGYSRRLIDSVRGKEGEIFDLDKLTGGRRAFGFFGGYTSGKGVDLLLKAAHLVKHHPEAVFVFAGQGALGRAIDLEAKRECSNVINLGLLGRRETIACMKQCEAIFAVHDKWQAMVGNPVKVVEAMAVGTPSIIPNDYHLPDELRKRSIILDRRNPSAIADVVAGALRNGIDHSIPADISKFSVEEITRTIILPAYRAIMDRASEA